MLEKLKNLFAKSSPRTEPTPSPAPLEILVPHGVHLTDAPRVAGALLSFLVACPYTTNTIELDCEGSRAHSSDTKLREFLALLVGAGQFNTLIAQCRSIMYPPNQEGSIGSLGCLQQGELHTFEIFELSPLPDLKWEIRRATHSVHGHAI